MELKVEDYKNAIIHCDIYRRDIMVHIGNLDGLRDNLMPFYNETDIDEVIAILMDTDRGKTLELTAGPVIVYLPIQPSSPTGIAALVHEMFHATHFILEKVGIKFSNDSDEAYAYLLDYLIDKTIITFSLSL